jgi:peroxiredoxin Q/BCP
MGVLRSTFVFDKKGTLIKVWPKVSPATHGEEIADYLRELKA